MIFALLLGAILGFTALDTAHAFLVLGASIALKAWIDVRYERMPFINTPSPYLLYCHNLAGSGEKTDHAWISYVLQLLVFGMLFGGGLLAFARYLRA